MKKRAKDGQLRFTVTARQEGVVLVQFLSDALGLSKKKAKGILDRREAFVNEKRVWMARHELRNGDLVEVLAPPGGAAQEAPIILFRDNMPGPYVLYSGSKAVL